MEDTCIFRHVIGHGAAPADQAVFLEEDGTIVVFDHDSEAGSSSRIDRLAGAIEPGKVFTHTAFLLGRRKGRGERGGGRGRRGWRWGEYIRRHTAPLFANVRT
jgi:hypothetical protein